MLLRLYYFYIFFFNCIVGLASLKRITHQRLLQGAIETHCLLTAGFLSTSSLQDILISSKIFKCNKIAIATFHIPKQDLRFHNVIINFKVFCKHGLSKLNIYPKKNLYFINLLLKLLERNISSERLDHKIMTSIRDIC